MAKIKQSSHFRRYLLAGILTIIPLWITWFVLSFLFAQLSSLGGPWVTALARGVSSSSPYLSEFLLHPWLQPVVATILILLGLYLLGWITTRVLGRRILNEFEALVTRIPLVDRIYGSTRKLLAALNQDNQKLDRVVLIDFPNETMKTIGFVTKIMHDKTNNQELAAVYVPTTPNPTSGYLEIIPTDRLVNTDLSVEDAMTFIISGGTVGPEHLSYESATG